VSGQERALRFAGLAAGGGDADGTGLVVTNTGAVATVAGAGAVRQSILLLLGTRPGERVMRPHYGSHLHRLLFAPNDHTTAGLAIHYVRQALRRWEPRVEILALDAGADPLQPSRLTIHLRYRVRASLVEDAVDYPLDLDPAPTGGAT
jgi:uncharacterized protein